MYIFIYHRRRLLLSPHSRGLLNHSFSFKGDLFKTFIRSSNSKDHNSPKKRPKNRAMLQMPPYSCWWSGSRRLQEGSTVHSVEDPQTMMEAELWALSWCCSSKLRLHQSSSDHDEAQSSSDRDGGGALSFIMVEAELLLNQNFDLFWGCGLHLFEFLISLTLNAVFNHFPSLFSGAVSFFLLDFEAKFTKF